MEVNNRFDVFGFIKNRQQSIEPTEVDLKTFDLFTFNRALSMARRHDVANVLNITNTMAFSRLKKHQQCKSMTSLDGSSWNGPWSLPTRKIETGNEKFIERVMLVLNCTRSDAESMINSGTVDENSINIAYDTVFDNVMTKKKGRSKR